MSGSNFSKKALNGEVREMQDAVDSLYRRFGFDFVSMGLTAFVGAPLRWFTVRAKHRAATGASRWRPGTASAASC